MKTSRSLSISMLLLGVVLFFMSIFIIKVDGAEIQQGRYIPKVIISASWGEKNLIYDEKSSNPGEFGLFDPPEGMDAGPDKGPFSFTVAPNGYIYISDDLNNRIQVFNPSGGLVSVIPGLHAGGEGMYIDQEGHIYVGNFDWTYYPVVEKYDQSGKLLKTYHLGKWDETGKSVTHWGGSGYISGDNSGRLFLRYSKVDLHNHNKPLFPGDTTPCNTEFIFQFGTTTQEFTFEQQMSTLKIPGTWSLNANLPDWENYLHKIKGKIYSLNSERNAQKSLAKKLAQPREGFIGIDEDAVYNIITDEKNPDSSVILKYNYDGDLIAIYNINWKEGECEALNIEYQEVAWVKKDKVFDKGNIYSYIHCKDGLKIIKWSPVEGKK